MNKTRPLLLTLLLVTCLPAYARVDEQLEFQYYDVMVAAGERWQEKVVPASPVNPHAGYTTPTLEWKIDAATGPNGSCSSSNVRILLGLTVLLPRISAPSEEAALQASRYTEALQNHEMGHVAIWRRAAAALDSSLMNLPPGPDCATIQNYADEQGQKMQTEAGEQDRLHDSPEEYRRVQESWH